MSSLERMGLAVSLAAALPGWQGQASHYPWGFPMAIALLPVAFPTPGFWVEWLVSAGLASCLYRRTCKGPCLPCCVSHWGLAGEQPCQGRQDTKWCFLLQLLPPGRGKAPFFFSTMPPKGQRGLYRSSPGEKPPQSRREAAGHRHAGQEPWGQPGPAPQGAAFTSSLPDVLSWPYLFVMNNYSSPFPSPPAWAQSSSLPKRQRHVKVCCRISIKLYALRPLAIMHFR